MMICTLAAAIVSLTFVGCGDKDEDTGVEDSAVEETEEQAEDE